MKKARGNLIPVHRFGGPGVGDSPVSPRQRLADINQVIGHHSESYPSFHSFHPAVQTSA
jgi:hypothetical protein